MNKYVLVGMMTLYCGVSVVDQTTVTQTAPTENDTFSDLLSKGKSAFAKEDFSAAIIAFSAAIEHSPHIALGYRERGRAKAGNKDFRAAIEDLTRAIELDPKEASNWFFRGNLYESLAWPMQAKEFPDAQRLALEDYDKALICNPSFATCLFARACYLLHYRLRDHGVADFAKSLQSDANSQERLDIVDRTAHRIRARLFFHGGGLERMHKRIGDISDVAVGQLSDFAEIATLCDQLNQQADLVLTDPKERQEKVFAVASDVIEVLTIIGGYVRASLPKERIGINVPQVSPVRLLRTKLISDQFYQLACIIAFRCCPCDSAESCGALGASLLHVGKRSGDRIFNVAVGILDFGGDNPVVNKQLRAEAAKHLIVSKLELAEHWACDIAPKEVDREWLYPGTIDDSPINRSAFMVWFRERLDEYEAKHSAALAARLQAVSFFASAEGMLFALSDIAEPDSTVEDRITRLRGILSLR
jgi:Tfp pilus assembly protein PilF